MWLHPATQPPKFGGVSSTWVVWANRQFATSFGFFSFFFCLLHHTYMSHFLTDHDDLYIQNMYFHARLCLLGVSTKNGHPRLPNPPKLKILHYRSRFAPNIMACFVTCTIQKLYKNFYLHSTVNSILHVSMETLSGVWTEVYTAQTWSSKQRRLLRSDVTLVDGKIRGLWFWK